MEENTLFSEIAARVEQGETSFNVSVKFRFNNLYFTLSSTDRKKIR